MYTSTKVDLRGKQMLIYLVVCGLNADSGLLGLVPARIRAEWK